MDHCLLLTNVQSHESCCFIYLAHFEVWGAILSRRVYSVLIYLPHLKQPLGYSQVNILSLLGISLRPDKDRKRVALLATEYLRLIWLSLGTFLP